LRSLADSSGLKQWLLAAKRKLRTWLPPLSRAFLIMKISGVDIRPGNILEYEKGIW
jgi:hypothetical protein